MLRGYQSFQLAFKVAGAAESENEVDQAEATKRVKQWVKLNPQTIAQKSALIVEHFRENVAVLLEGHAKGDGCRRFTVGGGPIQAGDRQVRRRQGL